MQTDDGAALTQKFTSTATSLLNTQPSYACLSIYFENRRENRQQRHLAAPRVRPLVIIIGRDQFGYKAAAGRCEATHLT